MHSAHSCYWDTNNDFVNQVTWPTNQNNNTCNKVLHDKDDDSNNDDDKKSRMICVVTIVAMSL